MKSAGATQGTEKRKCAIQGQNDSGISDDAVEIFWQVSGKKFRPKNEVENG